jgi:hypothetical protein
MDDSWNEYRRLILSELERIDKQVKSNADHIDGEVKTLLDFISQLRTDVEMLKVKAGVWGFLAGFIPAAAAALYVATSN